MAKYEVGDYAFDLKRFFPDPIFSAITEVRVSSPEIILRRPRRGRKERNSPGTASSRSSRRIIRAGW